MYTTPFAHQPWDRWEYERQQDWLRRQQFSEISRRRQAAQYLAEQARYNAQIRKRQEVERLARLQQEQSYRDSFIPPLPPRGRPVYSTADRECSGYDQYGRSVYKHAVPLSSSVLRNAAIRSHSSPGTQAAPQPSESGVEPRVDAATCSKPPEQKQSGVYRQEQAASTLQRRWRLRQSVTKREAQLEVVLADLTQFISQFSFPTSPTFDAKGALAYESHNKQVHAQIEELEKLLLRLDGIESGGSKRIKQKRRTLAQQIEAELSRIEDWKLQEYTNMKAQSRNSSNLHASASPLSAAEDRRALAVLSTDGGSFLRDIEKVAGRREQTCNNSHCRQDIPATDPCESIDEDFVLV